jgi:uncharacterized membrane protein
MDNVGIGEVNRDVAVGMGWWVILERDAGVVTTHFKLGYEYLYR